MKPDPLPLAAALLFLLTAHASGAVRYVNVNNSTPAAPYTTWSSAAKAIQTAVDAAATGDDILVTNGVYETGGRVAYGTLTNRVSVSKRVTVRSANGPAVTVIRGSPTNGDSAVRCVNWPVAPR